MFDTKIASIAFEGVLVTFFEAKTINNLFHFLYNFFFSDNIRILLSGILGIFLMCGASFMPMDL
jgi:hypothetical protein